MADCCSSGYYTADAQQGQYQQDGYYEGNQGYQDDYYDAQYYDQGAPGQAQGYSQNNGYRYGCAAMSWIEPWY